MYKTSETEKNRNELVVKTHFKTESYSNIIAHKRKISKSHVTVIGVSTLFSVMTQFR